MRRLGTPRPLLEPSSPEPQGRGASESWRIDRRIRPALLLTAAMQCAAAVAWGAYLEARVDALERESAAYIQLSEKFARLEERIDALRGDIAEIRHRMERK